MVLHDTQVGVGGVRGEREAHEVNNLGHALVFLPKDADKPLEVFRVFRRHHKFVLARSAEVLAGGHPKGSMPVSTQLLDHAVGDGR